ncbi:MAG: hypothetical protein ACI8W7_004230 [Gammaproteobacteria bacterium]|jgi:hypothetical protein
MTLLTQIASNDLLDSAYEWLCRRRRNYPGDLVKQSKTGGASGEIAKLRIGRIKALSRKRTKYSQVNKQPSTCGSTRCWPTLRPLLARRLRLHAARREPTAIRYVAASGILPPAAFVPPCTSSSGPRVDPAARLPRYRRPGSCSRHHVPTIPHVPGNVQRADVQEKPALTCRDVLMPRAHGCAEAALIKCVTMQR